MNKEGIMKLFYIYLSREYFKDMDSNEALKVMYALLDLLCGLYAIPGQNIKYSEGDYANGVAFTVKCYKEHMDKFCKEVSKIFPGIENHMRIEVYEQK